MVRSIGADHVIDYTREDFSKHGQHYPLCETSEAIGYLEKGHARGKVVITLDQNHNT
jgi:NADPH:quinone reductase-like Zn-dependent oxidoreductase